jgi:hypothetical protein
VEKKNKKNIKFLGRKQKKKEEKIPFGPNWKKKK